MGTVHQAIFKTLSARLAVAGYRMEFEHHAGLFTRHQPKELKRVDALPDTAAWVLFFGTEQMQRWFAKNGRPCTSVGLPYEGVKLSSIYPDALAAAGTLQDYYTRAVTAN
jgi:hypothetical protein